MKSKVLQIFLLGLLFSIPSRWLYGAEPANTEIVLLDGISAAIRFSASDETSAILLLNSDVELLAGILLVTQYGENWKAHPVDNVVRFKARRLGVLIRALAHVATQVGEKSDATKRERWLQHFTHIAGGKGAVQQLLSYSGATDEELKFWFSNMQLCQVQLQYMNDQIQMPTRTELKKMFEAGDHPLAGASFEEAEAAYEKIIRDKKLQRIVSEWLARFEQQGSIRFSK